MSNHSIKIEPQTGVRSLHRDKYACNCPFRAPFAVPGQLAGQLALIATPCNSTCPMFQDNGNGIVKLHCSGLEINYSTHDFTIGK